jgi:arylsulfatase A-like enzyme
MKILSHFLLLFAVTTTGFAASPNIVVILADDLGAGSVGAYGAPPALVRTPHIDQLSREGLRFTDASTPASICSPTRYGLLTGRYAWRIPALEYGVVNVFDPLVIDPAKPTLASFLKSKGYTTAAIGKWHLGYGDQPQLDHTGPLTPGPLQLGFDYHFAVPQNHGDMVGAYVENERIFGLRSNRLSPYSRTFYGSPYMGLDAPQRVEHDVMEVLTDRAVDWIHTLPPETPFFLYFAPVAVHHPITPSNRLRGTSPAGPYGDFIHDLDASVGRLMEALAYRGLKENTLVIFTSDNGGDIPQGRRGPENVAYERGLQANGAFRGDKHSTWRGGVQVPFIARWPAQIPVESESEALICTTDIFATVVELLQGTRDLPGFHWDSFSFLECLTNPAADSTRRHLVTSDVHGRLSIRDREWRYIDPTLPVRLPAETAKREKDHIPPSLFHLTTDPGETRNRFQDETEIVQQLRGKLLEIKEQP